MHKMDKVRFMRVLSLMVIDALLINLSIFISLFLRFEFSLSSLAESGFIQNYLNICIVYTLTSLILFFAFRLYSSLWEYAGVDEMRNIMISSLLCSGVLTALSFVTGNSLPRSVPVISFLMLSLMVCVVRFSYRVLRHWRNSSKEKTRVTITKEWEDNNNQDGKRDSYEITLIGKANGEEVYKNSKTLKPEEITYTWTGLDKYSNGN